MACAELPVDGSTVKLKGLPFKASPEEVCAFFAGMTLGSDNVFLKRHPDGRPNGEAFVVFESPAEARRAIQKDRETFSPKFGERYVRVYPTLDSDVADMQAAVQQQSMVPMGNGHSHSHSDGVVKIKSLPFDATQLDIIQFFEAFKLKPNGVQLLVRSDNKPTGEAFVDFEGPEEAVRAIKEKDHQVFHEKFGDRYVRLIQVSRKEMQATLALRFGGEGILKMKGIPFKASAADVRKFFTGYKIKPGGITFIMHPDGRPTGMAFIEFETPQEAVRVLEKDRAKFGPEYGDRYCMLQLVGRHEMDKVSLLRECDAPPGAPPSGSSTNGLNSFAGMLEGLSGIGARGGGGGLMGGHDAGALGGLKALQAAALAQAALANNPSLLMHAPPWLQLQLVNPSMLAALGMGVPSGEAGTPPGNGYPPQHHHLGGGAPNGGRHGMPNGMPNGMSNGHMDDLSMYGMPHHSGGGSAPHLPHSLLSAPTASLLHHQLGVSGAAPHRSSSSSHGNGNGHHGIGRAISSGLSGTGSSLAPHMGSGPLTSSGETLDSSGSIHGIPMGRGVHSSGGARPLSPSSTPPLQQLASAGDSIDSSYLSAMLWSNGDPGTANARAHDANVGDARGSQGLPAYDGVWGMKPSDGMRFGALA